MSTLLTVVVLVVAGVVAIMIITGVQEIATCDNDRYRRVLMSWLCESVVVVVGVTVLACVLMCMCMCQ